MNIDLKTGSEDDVRARLGAEGFRVACECGTEPPFKNAYWNEHRGGIYVDVISGAPLFSSADKFDSGTGWPSFTRPIFAGAIEEREDVSQGMSRVEARCADSGAHLGHVFPDGPPPSGRRYCINSASLRFIPEGELETSGYGHYHPLLDEGRTSPATRTIFLAAGCFWGVEAYFRLLPGVIDTEVGYMGGHVENPGYDRVCGGDTDHAETLRLDWDPAKTNIENLLGHFFAMHDPRSRDRQGNDIGSQYRSAIFVTGDQDRDVAFKTLKALAGAAGGDPRPLATELRFAPAFWPAETWHQDYLDKNPGGYCHVNLSPALKARKAGQ